MITGIARYMGLIALLFYALSLNGVAGPMRFTLAGVQTDRGQIGNAKCKSGYQIRLCTTPTAYNQARSISRYKIHVGVFRAPAPKRNAAQLWALYE